MSAGTPLASGGMLGFLRRPVRKTARGAATCPISNASFLEGESAGLETDYENAIDSQLRRMGIDPACVHVRACTVGRTPGGFDVVAGFLTLVQWEKTSGVRLMLGMPSLEKRVRRFASATWLADYSAFGGLWLTVSEKLDISAELRALLRQSASRATEEDAAYDVSESLPA